jgi:hypothetical protein
MLNQFYSKNEKFSLHIDVLFTITIELAVNLIWIFGGMRHGDG